MWNPIGYYMHIALLNVAPQSEDPGRIRPSLGRLILLDAGLEVSFRAFA